MFASPGPIIMQLGPLTIRWYGLLTAISFLIALYMMRKLLLHKQEQIGPSYSLIGFDDDMLSNYAITILVSALVGARLWFVLLNFDYFVNNPVEIPQIWLGGQSIQGGITGAALATVILYRKYTWDLLALLASVVPLGQAIGRWGNFFNEEAFGSVTELPWKLYISHTGLYHHPTFLYESLWNLMVFGMMMFINYRLNWTAPRIIGSYLVLYSAGRLMIEALRMDSLLLFGMPAASVISVITIVIGIYLIKKPGSRN